MNQSVTWGHSGLHEFTFSCHVCGMSATHRSQSVHFKALTLVCSRLSQYKAESFASRKPLSTNPTEMVSQCQSTEQDYSSLAGYSPWDGKELNQLKRLTHTHTCYAHINSYIK